MPSVICVVSHAAGLAIVAHVVPSAEYWYVSVAPLTPEAYPFVVGSPVDEASATVPRIACAAFAAAGSVSVAVGNVLSSCHVQLAGDASVLPARSTARMSSVCEPSAGVEASEYGLAHVVQLPASRRHS